MAESPAGKKAVGRQYTYAEIRRVEADARSRGRDAVNPRVSARRIVSVLGSSGRVEDWSRREDAKTIVRAQPTAEEIQIQQAAKQTSARLAIRKNEEEIVARDIKVTLNKLCAGNLPRLLEKLFASAASQERGSDLLTSGIFDKACSEVKFTQLYADLCKRLEERFKDSNLVVTNSHGHPISLFKKAILKKCQTLFESTTEGTEADKTKTLGNVRFIGELYRVRLLGPKVLLECVRDLIDVQLRTLQRFQVSELRLSEDRLEGVCLLLPLVLGTPEVQAQVSNLLRLLSSIKDSRSDLSTRIKCLLLVSAIQNLQESAQQGILARSGSL